MAIVAEYYASDLDSIPSRVIFWEVYFNKFIYLDENYENSTVAPCIANSDVIISVEKYLLFQPKVQFTNRNTSTM